MWLVKNGPNIYFSYYGAKESVVICVHRSHWREQTQDLLLVSLRIGGISLD